MIAMSSQKHPFRSFFSSVRLTVVLLALIITVSIIGTFIPQQESAREFLSSLTPQTAAFLIRLQVFDIFHSYVFWFLIFLLSMNILVCSIKRIAVTRSLLKTPAFPVLEGLFEKPEPQRIITADMTKDEALRRLETFLKKKFGKILMEEMNGGTYIFVERYRFSHLGVDALHLSILIIILGALIGSFFGFTGYLNLDEGQSTQTVILKGDHGFRPLGFTVRCDRFLVDFYDNGAPKTYRSDLSFIKDGCIAAQSAVLVNHPAVFEKIRFYQSSYGMSPESKAILTYTANGTRMREIAVSKGAVIELEGSKARATILRIEENMMDLGPAVKLSITSPRGNFQFWVFKNLAEIKKRLNRMPLEHMHLFNPGLFRPYVFTLKGMEERYRTGLLVVRDPGLPIVLTGSLLMLAGLLVVFWMFHRRFWICIDHMEGQTRICVAGKSHGKEWGIERESVALLSDIREEIKV